MPVDQYITIAILALTFALLIKSKIPPVAGARIKRYDRAAYATLITIAMVVVVAFGWMTMLNAALLASGAMILTGCMTFRQAGHSLEFKTLIIIASAIGLEAAATGSGLSAKITDIDSFKNLNTKGDHNGPQSTFFKRTGTYFTAKLVGP
jgi:hypothetical protein